MGHRRRIAEVVDGHDVDIRAERPLRPEEVAPDAPEPVDADANRHYLLALLESGLSLESSPAPPTPRL